VLTSRLKEVLSLVSRLWAGVKRVGDTIQCGLNTMQIALQVAIQFQQPIRRLLKAL
jgi:hypothetical protein